MCEKGHANFLFTKHIPDSALQGSVGEPQHLSDLSHGQLSPGRHSALLVVEDRIAAVADPWENRRRFRLQTGRHQIGTLAGFVSEEVAGFLRNPQPLALAVPGAVPLLPAVVVTQTLVELMSELVYVRLMPKLGTSWVAAATSG